MPTANRNAAQYYFALPRLCAAFRGESSQRTQQNWLEANVVGALVMLISYLAVARFLVTTSGARLFVVLIAAVIVTWLFWLLAFYINARIIALLRAARILTSLSNARAQSVLVGLITTAFAVYLCTGGPLLVTVGVVWIAALSINLGAAMVLELMRVRE